MDIDIFYYCDPFTCFYKVRRTDMIVKKVISHFVKTPPDKYRERVTLFIHLSIVIFGRLLVS